MIGISLSTGILIGSNRGGWLSVAAFGASSCE